MSGDESSDPFIQMSSEESSDIADETATTEQSRPRKSSLDLLRLKERRRQTLKYFAQNDELDKEDIMDFFQNEIRRKTSMDNDNQNIDDSDCKDDFDSNSDDMNKEKKQRQTIKTNAIGNNIKNAEEPSWNELLMDDSTRQQFEELAREYVGNIAGAKKKLQNEYYQLQQTYLKLQESNKANKENMDNLYENIKEKDEFILKLENEVTTLSVNRQDLQTDIAKLTLNLQHNEENTQTLNATIEEYKNQNILLSQQLLSKQIDANDAHSVEDAVEDKEQKYHMHGHGHGKDIIHSLHEINALIEEKTELKTEINGLKQEQQTLSLNNEALKNLIETHQTRNKNIQKQHEKVKNKLRHSMTKNEQFQIDINAKNEFIQQLKQQNQKLESSNQELMIINSDLRHELHIYDQTILKEKNKEIEPIKKKRTAPIFPVATDRPSEEEEDEDDEEEEEEALDINRERRASLPSSMYEDNLDIIVSSVNDDEYKFMEDLSRERKTLSGTQTRSQILKCCHSDAEKEFFFMMVLTVKLELTMAAGATNCKLADISPQDLWTAAQKKSLALHEFHPFIKNALIGVVNNNKNSNQQVKHHWSSYNSMIGDKLRQNDLKKYIANNPHWIDPEQPLKVNSKKKRKIVGDEDGMVLPVDLVPYSDKQSLIDEDEDDIYAKLKMNNKKTNVQRRDSQMIKKTISESFNELQKQGKESKDAINQDWNANNDMDLPDIVTFDLL